MNVYLIIVGILNALDAILHLGCVYFGAPCYRSYTAGEQMAFLRNKAVFNQH